MTIIKDTLPIAGLAVNIYKRQESDLNLPVAVVFLLHGRLGSSKSDKIARLVNALLDNENHSELSQSACKELVVVSFVCSGVSISDAILSVCLLIGSSQSRNETDR